MSTAISTSKVWTAWQWPAEVTQFAASHDTEQYLEPLREALAHLFPTAARAAVVLELDPELRDDRHIRFDVWVPTDDIPDYVKAKRAWHDELFQICPSVVVWVFRLSLVSLQ